MRADGGCHEAGRDVFVDTVGGQQEDGAGRDRHRQVVDLELRIDAERAAEIALLRRDDDPVILGQLLKGLAAEPPDAGIADTEPMRGGRLYDHDPRRADKAPVVTLMIRTRPHTAMPT